MKPANDKGAFLLQSTQTVMLDRLPSRAAKSAGSFDDKLAHLQASLDRVEQSQGLTLSSLEEKLEYKARRIRGVLVDLGFEKGKHAEIKVAGVGGPFLPVKSASEAGGFDRQLSRIRLARANVERLTRTLGSLPVRKPLSGELDDRLRLRRAQRSVHPLGRHAHRARFPERDPARRCAPPPTAR